MVENSLAEFRDHFVVGGLAGLEHFVAQRIDFQNLAIEIAQHAGHGGFSGCDSAGQADAQHQRSLLHAAATGAREPRRMRAAFTVLLMSIAIVSGPTPPGTGV